jgi:hypothetical protein
MNTNNILLAANLAAVLASASATAADAPAYQEQVLIIPRVDTPTQIGMYQDGSFRLNTDGTWSILSFKALGESTLGNLTGITSVELVAVPSNPVAIYLKVKGLEARCGFTSPARTHQRRTASQIDVNISVGLPTVPPVCPASLSPYYITVPLDVYGLSAGNYTYSVNGTKTGTFTLQRDNKFAEDCGLSMNCPY